MIICEAMRNPATFLLYPGRAGLEVPRIMVYVPSMPYRKLLATRLNPCQGTPKKKLYDVHISGTESKIAPTNSVLSIATVCTSHFGGRALLQKEGENLPRDSHTFQIPIMNTGLQGFDLSKKSHFPDRISPGKQTKFYQYMRRFISAMGQIVW